VEHLLILSYLLILFIGMWAGFIALQAHRDRGVTIARPLFIYLIWFNVMVFVILVGRYTATNLFMGNPPIVHALAHIGVMLFSFVALAETAYWLLRSACALRGRECTRTVTRVYLAVCVIFGLNCLASVGFWLWRDTRTWVSWNKTTMVVAAALICVAISAGLVWFRHEKNGHAADRSVRRFGLALLLGYGLFGAATAFGPDWYHALSALSWLWLSSVSLLWLRSHIHHFFPVNAASNLTKILDEFAARFSITKREREVMELLFHGKSYKEIEDQLCISLGTVKNHAYNLYRKVGVNSRAQLIHLAINSDSPPSSTTSATDTTP
jgi:DNA-binding CsgD family transcriptional regulator